MNRAAAYIWKDADLEIIPDEPQPTREGRAVRESKDSSGHEHKGKGAGGGQFTKGSGGAGSGKETPDLAEFGDDLSDDAKFLLKELL